jgi:5-methylcytosine-specific restriction enzyme A
MARYTGPAVVVRQAVLGRDLWVCARCGMGRDLQIHHRKPRGMGGTKDPAINLPSNLIALCLRCHDWVERNRRDAFALGLLVGQADDPATIPVQTWRGLLALAEDGTYEIMIGDTE